ncbi:hypothetical protein AO053_02580 [Haemophilus influenzae biotype aegyptius]|uniref:Phage tail collar-like protein n=1 Tax=Haemophilus influenzae biotype aegyptius TaxID=725 RepID=Q58ZA1_HAEIF|nr:hypothetical protein [Haemophilus influenzae]AAV37173.1 phage tail collar-like protein [Haemophilus influenzae biotype aegyptius]QEQ61253.1 hypothetical protein F1539_01930 [Haemophilus influenzae biotype aegyptius]QEQ61631.1 hypothetical protein F1539_04140 [Haemophilus influenzae biotype aegyptius]QEQ62871.1 hypothetical protein F1538_00810 [Haemophilus influenzae biotype aegyptius]QEQ63253.1 hypothetical protein F1538_03005 [Haemophilus influenzae biotype aegyptius]
MKVYFLKENLNSYQIFPIPQNLNDFVEMEAENESELETKQLIDFKSQYILVDRQPTELHKWNGNSWVVDKKKKTEIKRELIKNLVDSIDDTAANISARWTRFAEEYKEREAAAIAFKEANFAGEVSVYISSFATVAGLDNQSASLLILQQAESLRTLQQQLAVQRMRKYELKHEALSDEELQRIHDDIIGKMQALAEAQQ